MDDVKTVSIFLPFFGAALWGLSYALAEKVLLSVSISTYILISSVISAAAMLGLHYFSPLKISFAPLLEHKTAFIGFVAILAGTIAWLLTFIVIKNISANYASIAEISYPLFTVLFGFLIFGRKLDWSMAAGAVLIMAGSFLIVSDKLNGR
ncbi:MAG: DMT family transporter [Alphaproteobacteria bacterium]